MNYLLKDTLRKLAPCVGLVALAAVPAFAQNQQANIRVPAGAVVLVRHADVVAPAAGKPVPDVQLRPDQVVVNRRPAIPPTKPFPMADPMTLKPVTPDTTLTLPNGKTMTAREYWGELRGKEDQLNKLGYSVWPGQGSQEKVMQRTPTPTATLQRQAQALSASYVPGARFQPMDAGQAEQRQKTIIVLSPAQLANLSAIRGVFPLHSVKTWNLNFGDPSDISISLNGKVELDGTSTSTSLDAEADAKGSIFSQSFDVMNISGKLSSPQKGPLNVNVNATMLGFNVYNVNQNVTSTFSKKDSVSKTLDVGVTVAHFNLGPIPLSVRIGVQGTAGFSYVVTVAPVKASGQVAPSIKTNAYGEVGVDVGVAAAGVGGRLTILNLDGNLQGDVAIVPGANNSLNYSFDDKYCQTVDTLDGSFFAFVRVGIGPISKEFDHDLFTFPGIKSSGCLFNDVKTLPVSGTILRQ